MKYFQKLIDADTLYATNFHETPDGPTQLQPNIQVMGGVRFGIGVTSPETANGYKKNL